MRPAITATLALAVAVGLVACGGDAEPRAGRVDGADLVGSLGCSTVRADRDYLARSIEDPDAEIVDGFAPIMPDLGLEPDQVDAIVTYIEELS